MQPVDPSTIVRGPAALTMSFMTSADSQPWQVRWPDVKYSSIVTFLMPRKASSVCGEFVNVVVVSAIRSLSSVADAEPVRLQFRFARARGSVAHVRGFVDVLQRDFPASEAADERQQRRTAIGVVHRGAHLGGNDAGVERRAERVVAVDHTDRLRLRQRGDELVGGERTEPP